MTGALNDNLDQVSARYAHLVVRQAMLANREGFPLGLATVPLGKLHDQFPRSILEKYGVHIYTGQAVIRLNFDENDVTGIATSTEVFNADYVVLAVDSTSMNLVPADVVKTNNRAKPELSPAQSPILTLYLWYKGQIDLKSPLCMPGRHFHWCFDRSTFTPKLSGAETALSLVASAARNLINLVDEEICDIGRKELEESLRRKIPFPDNWAVVRHKNATFSPLLEYDSVRPMQRTNIHNLFLAGDWTDTGWPGTMEGAIRSGYICAREILAQEGINYDLLIPDLPAKGFSKLLLH
jgi:2-polyprenyl-6-methoxyphenol hydroxylase-like FAD-dependent oxidoreductase